MDVKVLKRVLGVGLLTAAAITNSTAHAANANVQVDVDLPTVLVMYHYNTITLDLDQAALAGYLVGGTAIACGTDYCDDQGNPALIPVNTITGTDTVLQAVVDPGPAATTADFTLQDVVGVRAFGCTSYSTVITDGGSELGVNITTAGGVNGIEGAACSFGMTTGDLSFELDFATLDATDTTATAIFNVDITGV